MVGMVIVRIGDDAGRTHFAVKCHDIGRPFGCPLFRIDLVALGLGDGSVVERHVDAEVDNGTVFLLALDLHLIGHRPASDTGIGKREGFRLVIDLILEIGGGRRDAR